MAVRIEKDGWAVTADTLEELEMGILAVQHALEGPPKRGPGRPPGKTKNGHAAEKRKLKENKRIALTFLRTIQSADEGATSADLVQALAVKHAKALGSPAGVVNKMLESLGFDRKKVYAAEKKFGEKTRRYRKPQMDAAIEAIENMEE